MSDPIAEALEVDAFLNGRRAGKTITALLWARRFRAMAWRDWQIFGRHFGLPRPRWARLRAALWAATR